MKGAYKKRDRRYATRRSGEPHAAKRRDRRRNLRIIVVASLVCALLALIVVDYLSDGVELLQGFRADEPTGSENAERAVPPQGTAEQEKAAGEPEPSILLGEFFTDYAWDPDPGRRANLKMASEAIDGTLLAPGETFSALDTLGGVEYEAAKVFASGGIDYEVGGGLCQVSSTLYMAANYAGLEIVERNPHYAELPYIRPGFDATVWFGENGWGALDMRFKNNTNGNILIREFVNEHGFLVAQIWGEESPDKTVSMDSERVEENINKGLKWVTYKKVIDGNDRVIEDDVLYETTYSYNPPVPEEFKHETNEPRGAGWLDLSNTTNWNDKDD